MSRTRLQTAFLILLIFSLAGNFFAVGYIAHGWRSGSAASFLDFEARYQSDVRAAFGDVLRENRDAVRSAVAELTAARDAQADLARQHPLNETTIRTAMANVRGKTEALQTILQEYLLSALKHAEADAKNP
ncbi:periplasmic heavy metal sensor [Agrobacterium vitis]|uniref:periplasmic heavy metal sensor n=1 Tax=Rhizobium/Agrobacterium group TaxID=227290 RepID=UPI000872F421|nr:periplasmic heavy metal sensor [Agrobacterium vitis]MCE6076734.1 periplasmic heavy metal sensor [Agrobacterium vitis]MCM2471087.1 periplasmic heavy metal sensor [Agrobacterium vitis]MUO71119.1 periplasmic heavy metal sensor [Agrobacterium vitis]MUO84418.1 periplasmic heavy metal sensor [Agrobacterium vitis]MVA38096.1 periplasmic heavy metal sensor [Agrobacterium vitis]